MDQIEKATLLGEIYELGEQFTAANQNNQHTMACMLSKKLTAAFEKFSFLYNTDNEFNAAIRNFKRNPSATNWIAMEATAMVYQHIHSN